MQKTHLSARRSRPALLLTATAAAGCLLAARPAAAASAVHPARTDPPSIPVRTDWASVPFGQRHPVWPPLSLVSEDKTGAFYSRAVNLFTCYARAGDLTWIGTPAGVKRLDRKRKTVRHYTRAEGLPENSVVALAADGDEAWCIVRLLRAGAPAMAFCRFDPRTQRWQTLREVSLEGADPNFRPTHPFPHERPVVAAAPDFVCFSLGTAWPTKEAGLLIWDRRTHRLEAVSPPAAGSVPGAPVQVVFARAEPGTLWLGTDAGLFRYARQGGGWQRFLPDRALFTGARIGGSWWLLTRPRAGGRDPARWRLARVAAPARDARITGDDVTDHALPAPNRSGRLNGYPYDGHPVGVAAGAGGAVWVTMARMGQPHVPAFLRFDPAGGDWRRFDTWRPGAQDEVPDAALLASASESARSPGLTDSVSPFAVELARRLPGWFCPEAVLPENLRRPPETGIAARVEEPGGVVWTAAGEALVRREGEREERFPVPRDPVALPPVAHHIALLGNTLYVALSDGVYALDLRTKIWRNIDLVARPVWSGSGPPLAARGGRLVVRDEGNGVLAYNPDRSAFTVLLPDAGVQGRRLLDVGNDGTLWLTGWNDALYRADPKKETTEPVTPPAPPPGLELPAGAHYRPLSVTPGATDGDVVWFSLPLATEGVAVAGYAPRSRTWTAPLRLNDLAWNTGPVAGPDGAYIATGDETAAVRRYDSRARAWSGAAPPLPPQPGGRHGPPLLVSLDSRRLWLVDPQRSSLWEWDRSRGAWSSFPLPAPLRGASVGRGGGVRTDDALFLAMGSALWRFDLASRAWRRETMPVRGGFHLDQIAADPSAIWGLLRSPLSAQRVAGRWDRLTRRWTLWGDEQDFPEYANPSRLVADGTSVWALGSGGLFRLDPAAGRWQPVITLLSGDPDVQAYLGEVVPDGAQTWFLITSVRYRTAATTLRDGKDRPRALVLVRHDRASGTFERFYAPGDVEVSSGLLPFFYFAERRKLLIEKDAVWVATENGAGRWDRRSRTWRTIPAPDTVSRGGFPAERIVRGADGTLWFMNGHSVLRSVER